MAAGYVWRAGSVGAGDVLPGEVCLQPLLECCRREMVDGRREVPDVRYHVYPGA